MERRTVPTPTLAALALLAGLVLAGGVMAYPRPAAIPYRWELDFQAGDLRLYLDEASGAAYWYFTYTVTNRTSRDQVWAAQFTLFTDAGEIMVSGREVPLHVPRDLLELLDNEYIEHQNVIIGEIYQGPEHAKEGLVAWPAPNTAVNELTLFVRGISGESARTNNPLTGREVVLYKTLQLDYLIPGDALARGSRPIELVRQRWILR